MPTLTHEEELAESNRLSAALRGVQFAAIRWQQLPKEACPEERLRAADAFLAAAWAWQAALLSTRLSAQRVRLLLEPHLDSIQEAIRMGERGNAASARQTAASLAELEAEAERQGKFLLDAIDSGGLPKGTVDAWGRALTLARTWRQAAIAAEVLTERLMHPLQAAPLHELRTHFMEGAVKAEEALREFFREVEQGRLPSHETLQAWEERFGYACRNLRVLMRRLDPDRLALLHHAVILYRRDAAPEDRWAAARRFVATLTPRLRNLDAWKEVCRQAEERGRTPEAVLAEMLFPEGAMLAADGADEPRLIRMGEQWIKGADGKPAPVAPAHDLTITEFVDWLRQEVYAQASDILTEPIAAGDQLADAVQGLDPNREGAPAPDVDESGWESLFEVLLQAAPPSKRRQLAAASPTLREKFRAALLLLRDGAAGEAIDALHDLGMSDDVIRKTRERLRRRTSTSHPR